MMTKALEEQIRDKIGAAMREAGYDTAGSIAERFFATLTASIMQTLRPKR
jgi:hypothetical protein